MGVMPCQRGNCSTILCDRYSNKYGYICNSCFEELVESSLTIEEFLETKVKNSVQSRSWRRERLEKEFIKD